MARRSEASADSIWRKPRASLGVGAEPLDRRCIEGGRVREDGARGDVSPRGAAGGGRRLDGRDKLRRRHAEAQESALGVSGQRTQRREGRAVHRLAAAGTQQYRLGVHGLLRAGDNRLVARAFEEHLRRCRQAGRLGGAGREERERAHWQRLIPEREGDLGGLLEVRAAQRERAPRERQWRDLERGLDQHPERAERARVHAMKIVAADVLHHAPAGLHDGALGGHDRGAEDEVTRCGQVPPPGARARGGKQAADRDAVVGRRVDGQVLPALAEDGLQPREGHARLDGHREVFRLVRDHAVEAGRVEGDIVRRERPAEAERGAAALRDDGLARLVGRGKHGCHLVARLRAEGVRGRHTVDRIVRGGPLAARRQRGGAMTRSGRHQR